MRKYLILSFVLIILIAILAGCSSADAAPKQTLEFIRGEVISGDQVGYDHDLVSLFFKYTNNSGETCIPCDEFSVKAFQDGKEITVMVFTGQKTRGAIQCDASVQTGTTADVIWLYQLENDNTVSVECSNGEKFEVEIHR